MKIEKKDGWQDILQCCGEDGLIYIFRPHPLLSKKHTDKSIEIFEKTKPSFLISIDSSGLDARAIYITSAWHLKKHGQFFANCSNSFVYMLDNARYNTQKQRQLARKYQDNMKDYDEEFLDGKKITDPVVLRSSRDAPQRIAKLVQIPKGKRILDVGCSSGNVTIRYARKASEDSYILGVDIDSELINIANSYLQKEDEKTRYIAHFVNLPIEKLQESVESFDTITATEFFEHVVHTEHPELMRQCLEYLKLDGQMIVSVPNRFPGQVYEQEKRYRWDWFNHYSHFTKKSLEYFMDQYFRQVKFHTVYEEKPEEGIFLIAEGRHKK
ncbi:MAG TPA: class I SAM-dependent methyltransferase [Candidatus Methylomirabilis sp.]|nr:class I SAM-dependent methyltransferase [Candidatus Methylomirabilis sp.]